MKITIREVAREAGVSVATVSRVLNSSGPVNAETAQRVEEVANELGYVPHGTARSLKTRQTLTLGVLLPGLHGEFFAEVIRGIDERAQQHEYHLLISSSLKNEKQLRGAIQAVRGRVDGLIIMSPLVDATTLKRHLPRGLPVVLTNCSPEGSSFDVLNIDNRGGTYAMVRRLLRLGHRRVAIIKGRADNYDADERLQGYRAAMEDEGLDASQRLEVEGDFSDASGYRAVHQILAHEPRPTAIFASNDSMAIGALRALQEAEVRVPDDMAIAGFDDIPMARYTNPPLASVRVHVFELGARATERLVQKMQGETTDEVWHEVIPYDLALRASCGSIQDD